MKDVAFRPGRVGDTDAIRALLASAALPVDDLTGGKQEFLVAEVGERVVGCVGIEMAGEACLLRSLVVLPEPGRRRADDAEAEEGRPGVTSCGARAS